MKTDHSHRDRQNYYKRRFDDYQKWIADLHKRVEDLALENVRLKLELEMKK